MSEPRIPAAPRPTRRSALLLWIIAAVGLFVSAVVFALLLLSIGDMDTQWLMLIDALIYYLPFLALPVYLVARRAPGMWRSLRPYPLSIFSTLGIIMLALMSVILMTNIVALWTIVLEAVGLDGGGSSLVVPTNAPGLMLCILHMAVLPAVCEEFLFRGVVLSAFERNGTRHAVAVSAVMFALLHGSLSGLPAHLLLGLILGALVVCCNSIYAGLIFHTTYNAATVILVFLASRSVDTAASESARMIDAAGGLPGVLSLMIETLMLGSVALFALRIFRLTAIRRGVTFAPRRRESLRRSEWALLSVGALLALLLFVVQELV